MNDPHVEAPYLRVEPLIEQELNVYCYCNHFGHNAAVPTGGDDREFHRRAVPSGQQAMKAPDPGVFLTKGMQARIRNFSIRISPDGKLKGDPVILETGLDVCPYWLEIAYGHLLRTEKANDKLLIAKKAQDNKKIGDALDAELIAGMQTIMASACSMDAYYASIKQRIQIPDDLTRTWRENRTARFRQIDQVLQRAFPMSNKAKKTMRTILKETMSFRDKAVHPSSETVLPDLHPELNKVTDWRYVAFRYYNAKASAGTILSIIAQTAGRPPKDKSEKLAIYCATLETRVRPLVKRWERRYGKLYG